MGRRICCVPGCDSNEQSDVSFHAFPQDEQVRALWKSSTRYAEREITRSVLVCSNHFRETDFNKIKSGKLVLKSRIIPSLFPWGNLSDNEVEAKRIELGAKSNSAVTSPAPKTSHDDNVTEATVDAKVAQILAETAAAEVVKVGNSPFECKRKRSSRSRSSQRAVIRYEEVTNFDIGMQLEVKEAGNVWLPGRVSEYNEEKNEVLIRFERNGRSRPHGTKSGRWVKVEPGRFQKEVSTGLERFSVGERCMARWSGLGMYACTVKKKLEAEDTYEVLFDDGFYRSVHARDMSKIVTNKVDQTIAEKDPVIQNLVKPDEPTTSVATKSSPIVPAATNSSKKKTPNRRRSWTLMDMSKLDLDALNLPDIPHDGEWTCHWVNDQPIGQKGFLLIGDYQKPTVIVDDWRLPSGWIKHMYQRSNILGKWDVILVAPNGKRFRSKSDLKQFLEQQKIPYNPDIYDFSIHRRRAKDIKAYVYTKDYSAESNKMPTKSATPLDICLSDSFNTSAGEESSKSGIGEAEIAPDTASLTINDLLTNTNNPDDAIETDDGFAYIGALKVEIVDNLFRCPGASEGCNKVFRKEEHVLVHIHHYHKELSKQIGACPKMQELAEKRTHPVIRDQELTPRNQIPNQEFFAKLHQQDVQHSRAFKHKQQNVTASTLPSTDPVMAETILEPAVPEKVATLPELPVCDFKNLSQTEDIVEFADPSFAVSPSTQPSQVIPSRKSNRQRTTRRYWVDPPKKSKPNVNEDIKTQIKRPRLSSLSSVDSSATTSTANATVLQANITAADISTSTIKMENRTNKPQYIKENGELIKIVRMRQEEIINCACDYYEEDGLMIQCELCLTWQHGGCHNILKESDVPEKYVCFRCRSPKRERTTMRYKHDQDWLYMGKLPTANYHATNPNASKQIEFFKATNTIAGNTLEAQNSIRSLQAKINIVSNPAHPKLYLWAQDWDKLPEDAIKTEDEANETPITPNVPQPEAAINTEECQHRLMKHIDVQKKHLCQYLDELEAELERLELEQHYLGAIEPSEAVLKDALSVYIEDMKLAEKMADINIITSKKIVIAKELAAKAAAEANEASKQLQTSATSL